MSNRQQERQRDDGTRSYDRTVSQFRNFKSIECSLFMVREYEHMFVKCSLFSYMTSNERKGTSEFHVFNLINIE